MGNRKLIANDGYAMTLAEVAKELGVSRERVRQIEFVALRKARRAADALGLRDFLEWLDGQDGRRAERDDWRVPYTIPIGDDPDPEPEPADS